MVHAERWRRDVSQSWWLSTRLWHRLLQGVKDTKSTAMSLEPCGRLRICKFAHFVQRMGKENHQHLKSGALSQNAIPNIMGEEG